MAVVHISSNSSSTHRMMKDIAEIEKLPPLLNVSGMHLEEDIFEWHINLRPANENSSKFCCTPFHLIARFPQNYPRSPPHIKACTFIAHPNVIRSNSGEYEICLEMLKQSNNHQSDSIVRPYEGWSSAFSVYSLLMQLQAILIDGHEYMMKHGSAEDAVFEAQSFSCNVCKHSCSTPNPAFSSEEEMINFIEPQVPIDPGMMKNVIDRSRHSLYSKSERPRKAELSAAKKRSPVETTAAKVVKGEVAVKPSKLSEQTEDSWILVKSKKTMKKVSSLLMSKHSTQHHNSDTIQLFNCFDALENNRSFLLRCEDCREMLEAHNFSNSQLKKADLSAKFCKACILKKTPKPSDKEEVAPALDLRLMSKSQRRNFMRREKKRALLAAKVLETLDDTGKKQQNVQTPSLATPSITATEKGKTIPNTQTPERTKPAIKEQSLFWKKEWTSSCESLGSFKALSFHTMTRILTFLGSAEVMEASSTCKYLAVVAEDGIIWRHIFSKRYPNSKLVAENISDWKYAFLMEVNHIQRDICCWYSKSSFQEDVLGIPLDYTVNPKTEKVDYISSSFDLLSKTVFYEVGVRRTVWNEPFKLWLPLYLTAEHFDRALPFLRRTFPKLCPHRNTTSFEPLMILDVLPTIMNTIVVLVADGGVANSERILEGYCQIHRLFLALIEKFPSLQNNIEKKLHDFITKPTIRTKDHTPGLGQIICLLSVSKKFDWMKMAKAYITESFDRNVLWVCKKYPELANIEKGDQSRLEKVFDASKVRFRHLLFHVYFLHSIAKQANAEFYDVAYGSPPAKMKAEFQKVIGCILNLSSWPDFFKLAHLNCPSREQLTFWLESAVENSLKKGYHSKHTRFHAIQKSGVSKILLKGESYTVPPNMSELRLENHWAWNHGSQFLDASVLFFGFDKHLDRKVDYARQVAYGGAVLHSGDIMEFGNNRGTHIIELNVRRIPSHIQSIVFVLSAFSRAKLKDIIQPTVHVHDSTTGMELCKYSHDSSVSANNKAVIMSCLWREENLKSHWHMDAFGIECVSGDALNYSPIISQIQKSVLKK